MSSLLQCEYTMQPHKQRPYSDSTRLKVNLECYSFASLQFFVICFLIYLSPAHHSRLGQILISHESQLDLLLAAYPTAAGSHRLRYIPGSYKAWNPNDELEDMTPQELAAHQHAGQSMALDLALSVCEYSHTCDPFLCTVQLSSAACDAALVR